ncbi:F-box/FBD/LRR-repeat protein [Trifolium repens]|nr:F-box/FBD/LRR-repeat protein [Trifolium repens]
MLSPLSANTALKKFSLDCDYYLGYDNHIRLWLEAAKQRRVEEFHLSFGLDSIRVNANIFISQTLVVLKLEKLRITSDTSCVHLPSLKTLHLKLVSFDNQNECINFLSACPNLKDLHVEVSCTRHYGNYALREWTIDYMFDVVKNVQFLSIACNPGNQQCSFKNIPVFQNLIHIELWFRCCLCLYWDDVAELLRYCPKLQILLINKYKETNSSKEWKHPISVFECVRSHLRSCTILNFNGSTNDLQFATYILQNASHLQDMNIRGWTTFVSRLDNDSVWIDGFNLILLY